MQMEAGCWNLNAQKKITPEQNLDKRNYVLAIMNYKTKEHIITIQN
jgi:hypothetical protein